MRVAFIWPAWCDPQKTERTHASDAWELVRQCVREDFSQCEVKHFMLLREYLPRGTKPKKFTMLAEVERVKAKLADYGADFVVMVGSHVFSLFCPKLKITVWGGREVRSDVLAMRGSGVIHPDVVSKLPVKRRDFVMQMRTIARAVQGERGFTGGASTKWETVTDAADVGARLAALRSPTAFDFETNGKETTDPEFRIRSVGFCDEPGVAFSVPYETAPAETRRAVRNWVVKSRTIKIAHNAKYEVRTSRSVFGRAPKALMFCTMMMHHLVNEDSTHKLENLAFEYTPLGGYDNEMKRLLDQEGFTHATVPMEKLAWYNAGDCDATLRLYHALRKQVDDDRHANRLWWFYRTIVRPTWGSLAVMEDNGFNVSEEAEKDLQAELQARVAELRGRFDKNPRVREAMRRLRKDGKEPPRFNPKSTKHCTTLFYGVMEEPVRVLTKAKGPACNAEALAAMSTPLAAMVTEARELTHDCSVAKEIMAVRRHDGRCSTNFYAAGTVTWRLASWDPNLQNLPRNGRVKKVFTSRFDGGCIIQGDFSQLEVRILGCLSGDKKYCAALLAGYDFHQYTASRIYKVEMADVTEDQRNTGKRANFGVIFGIGAKKLAKQTGLSEREAQRILDGYFSEYKAVDRFFKENRQKATKYLRVVTAMGQVRRVPKARDADKMERWHAQRQACNTLIQGSGAALTLFSMNRLCHEFEVRGLRALVIGQVHDSVVVDSPAEEKQLVADLMHSIMTDETQARFPWITIPLLVDVKAGPSLGEQVEKLKRSAAA